MEYILYICRFLYRIRWWLIGGTLAITLAAIFITKKMAKRYDVDCTVYTGIVSGYTIEGETTKKWDAAQNAMDNLINIITSESTLQRVSLRLYARCLINGNPNKDNDFITAANYNKIYNHVAKSPQGKIILGMINKKSEDETVKNFTAFFKPDRYNYLYGLFHYYMPHFSYNALKNIKVERQGSSDLLRLSYEDEDPGIAYNTLLILSTEFVNEYSSIRYGETDKVIEYFKNQLAKIGIDLRSQEDDLTSYNISKRVINYIDETKEIAAINKEFELRDQDALLSYNSSKAALQELERHMDSNAKQLTTNLDFLSKLSQVSNLQSRVSEAEVLPNENNTTTSNIQNYKNQLSKAQKELSGISDRYIKHQYTKEGIAKDNIVDDWLSELITFEKSKADLKVMNKARNELNNRYVFFAPVGSTINRKERSISFVEQNYLSLLKSYNDALMRKKTLEMTSATLKVLSPPSYPLSPQASIRRKIVMAVFVGTFLFILGFFLIIELFDQTLRDTIRASRLTKAQILGSYPGKSVLKFRNYNEVSENMATKYLSSSILRFFTTRQEGCPYIVNLISTEYGTGKTYLCDKLKTYWNDIGLKTSTLSAGIDFKPDSKEYVLARSIKDLYTPRDENILIVEYPSLRDNNIPSDLLQEANLNLIIARADHGWKTTDKIIYRNLKGQTNDTPLYMYLNQASREEVENYTGMLPPYTFIRRLLYRYSQLALTEHSSDIKPNTQTVKSDDDDEE